MRKFLITMMCIIMVVCFMPTVAMAEVETLPTAIDGVITLSEDVVLSESWTIDSSETFVLNLNGYSIKFTNAGVGIKNDGKLTINDTEGGRVFTTDVADQGRATIANYGTLEINGGTFGDSDIDRSNPNGVNRGNALRNYGTATINGGYFTACDNYTNGGYAYAIANGSSSYNDAQMTINNATVYGKMNGVIASDGGTLIVKNGSFTLGDETSSNNFYMAYTSGEGKIKVEGGTFERNVNNNYGFFYEALGSTSEIIATGGTFSSDVSAYVPEGTQTVDNGDGKYSLAPANNAVAQIGVAGYATLQAAIASATNGQTVTLLKDVTLNETVTVSKVLTLNTNGKTVSTAAGVRGITVMNGKLTVTGGGKFDAPASQTGDNSSLIDLSSGELIVDDANFEGANTCIGVTGGIATINDATMKAVNGGCCGLVKESGVINVYGVTFTCSGDDPDGPGCFWASDGGTVNIYGGTYNAALLSDVTQEGETLGANYCLYDYRDAGEYGYVRGYINVYGGTFLDFNPADNYNHDSFVADGYEAVENGEGTWIVESILADYSKVDAAITKAKALNKNDYKDFTAVEAAVNAVVRNKNITEQAEVDAMAKAIEDAIAALEKKPATGPSIPSTPTDNVTNSGTSGTDNATTSADLSGSTSTSNGTTSATVDKTTADKIVDKAVENKSEEIVIDATANTTTAADSTTIAQVTIPTETLGAIAEKTEADVTIKTDVAEVKMDNAAAAAVSEQAEGDTVQIVAEKVKEDATEVHFELKVVCSDGKVISDFKGGNVAVTVALPKAIADKKVVCVYIDDNGHMSKVAGQKNADGTYTFNTGHFSSYAIMAEEEADAAIAAQKEAIKNIKIKLTSKQVKTKAGKKAVKIAWTAAAGDKVLDGVEVYRSTERYKGYGTEPFYTSTKGGNTGSYTNTKSLKKGTKYYYRVRGYVLVNGEKVYTDYSTKAWRTVK